MDSFSCLMVLASCEKYGDCTFGCTDTAGIVIYDTETYEDYTEEDCMQKAEQRETPGKDCWYEWDSY